MRGFLVCALVALCPLVAFGESVSSTCAAPAEAPPGSTPPRLAQGSRELELALSSCYPDEARRQGTEGRLLMDVLVGEDGTASKTSLPEGAADWQRKAADCVARKLRFEPGRLADGTPFPATARVPIAFSLAAEGEDVSPVVFASLTSTQEEIAQVHRACYPAELPATGTSGEVLYKVRLSERGRITRLDLLRSSGDARIDEAGRCILKGYKFDPARRDGRPLVSAFPWTVKVQPPSP
ncbi:MAG: TonB family protein [Steroidobacteraceae bacterium]|nr:TonB family protein [Steroidobacteraceae bacterium]